jgi:tRNA(Ile)-lysidine synthase TilS/MesJ
MTLQKLLSVIRKAVDERGMITKGDRIAVGLSGGKDSLALLAGLNGLKRFYPEPFGLCAVTVDLGLGADYGPLRDYCASLGVDFHLIKTDIGEIIFGRRKEKNPCSLCSKMRRGALNSFITKNGFTKLALGHHADDLIETLFLSLLYEGRLSTFAPVSYMDRSGVTLIRPLIYAFEKDIAAFSKNLPVVHNPCPVNHETQREYMKNLIKSLSKDIPAAKDRMLSAIVRPERNNLWEILPKPE